VQAADGDLPVCRDDREIGVEGEVAQGKAGFGRRGTCGVVLGEHDVQVAEAQVGYGGRPVVFGDDRLDGWMSGGEGAQRAQPARVDHPEVLLSFYGRQFTFTFISQRATMPVMTQTKGMIARTWSATADADGAGNYSRYFEGTLLPELRKLPGFKGGCLLRRNLGEDGTAELTAHTFWESAEAIRAFAGNDITVSVVEPEAQAMLLDFDRTAIHRTVVVDARD
jgi:heme-degrading monooxygenase HmoA